MQDRRKEIPPPGSCALARTNASSPTTTEDTVRLLTDGPSASRLPVPPPSPPPSACTYTSKKTSHKKTKLGAAKESRIVQNFLLSFRRSCRFPHALTLSTTAAAMGYGGGTARALRCPCLHQQAALLLRGRLGRPVDAVGEPSAPALLRGVIGFLVRRFGRDFAGRLPHLFHDRFAPRSRSTRPQRGASVAPPPSWLRDVLAGRRAGLEFLSSARCGAP